MFKLERRVTTLSTGKVICEVQYGLTEEKASPKRLLEIVRSEWGIENGLHYRRDVTYKEDETRMTKKLWRLVYSIIKGLIIKPCKRFFPHLRNLRKALSFLPPKQEHPKNSPELFLKSAFTSWINFCRVHCQVVCFRESLDTNFGNRNNRSW